MELHNSEPNAFGEQESSELQDSGASAAPAARGASRILVADATGTVVLPAGTELGDIRVEGRDLVVIGSDGVRYVIPDGAIIVPQIVIDDVAIPPLNLAALLIGNEPQPAAGNPQSSGGNFSRAVGPLQAAFELGDLLPYTELAFPEPEEREIIPQRPDREPDVIVVTPDQPAGATSATASVNEAGLPARGNEPAGSNAASNSETTTGTIVFGAPDGLSSIAINGTVITAVGQTIVSPNGTLTITSIAPGVIGYSYTLTDNMLGDATVDNFTIAVTDTDGDVAQAMLGISVVDDVPTARADTDTVAAGTYGPETGNVMSGAGTTSGATGADTQGADGARVTSISGTGGSDTTFDSAGNLVVTGRYGTLTIKADGSYSYVRAPNTAGGVTDQFTYIITDGDGDTSSATLTINIGDSPASVVTLPTSGAGTVVNEAGLPVRPSEAPGTAAPTNVETTAGTITVVAPDGIASVQVGGVTVTGPGQTITVPQGTLTITGYNPATGTITYSFTLGDNTAGDSTTVSFPITVTDVDGDSDTKTLTITILDDAPTAVNDTATQSAENVPVTVNVLSNDIQGADSVQPGTVTLVPGTLSGSGTLVNNGNGTFTYTPASGETGTVTFDYTITDGDGDTSRATVTLTMAPDSVPTIKVEGDNTVSEAALPARTGEPAGSNAASPDETAAGTIAITTGGDTIGSLVINGVNVTAGGTVTTAKGVLTVTLSGGAYSYSYTLTDNTLTDPDSDTFTLTVTDSDGDPASTTLVIAIADDVPTAADDAGSVPTGTYGPIGGSVTGNDTPGADGIVVTSYTGVTSGAAGSTIDGTYGKLTIAADGTYSYTRNPGTPGGVTDSFTYTVRDGDGDIATANLVISIGDGKTSLDLPPAGIPGSTLVLEEGLADGSNAAGNGEFANGSFTFTAPDGPAKITIDGTPITAVGQVINGTYGTLTITSIAAGSIGYSYELTTNTSGDATFDDFAIVVADQDNDSTGGTLRINIVDDVPTANDDVDAVKEDGPLTATGNVITGTDGTFPPDANATDGVEDVKGADGATVTAIVFNPAGGGAAVSGTVDGSTAGLYGTLTLNADGSFSYALNNANPLVQGLDKNETLTETFTYTLTDGDTDADTATLTITINGTDDGVTITGLNLVGGEETVFENDLSDGSSPAAANLTQAGTFTVTALDGIQTITVGGITVFSGGGTITTGSTFNAAFGTLTITSITPTTTDANGDVTAATIGYSYTLNDNTLTHTGATDAQLTDTFVVTVTDTDGTVATDNLDVVVVDDVPTAVDDGAFDVAEATPRVIDALINDTKGADGVNLATGVVVATNPAKGTVSYNGDGTFTYTPNAGAEGADSFTYTIKDGDGDISTATVTLNLLADSVPVVKSTTNLTVDEDGLPGANVDAVPLQSNPAEIDGSESLTATGTAVVNFGADVPANLLASIVLLDNAAYDTQLLTLDGNPVTFAVEAGVLIGRDSGGQEVIRVTVTAAAPGPTTGDVTYTYTTLLSQPVKHAVTGSEDLDTLSGITFRVTDSETDTATGTFSVSVLDDVPSASDYTGATFAEGSGAHTIGAAATVLGIVGGADGLTVPLSSIAFTNTSATGGTLAINGAGELVYTSPTVATGTPTETFTYTVTDRDGDTVTKTVTFGVSDTGITNPAATSSSIDEDDIAGANGVAGGPGDLTTPVPTGTISYTKGADAITSITLSTGAIGFTKLDGTAITTSYNAGTGVLTGHAVGNPADVVFTITLGALGQASTGYTLNLLQPVKHPVGDNPATVGTNESTEDDLSVAVNVVITDADGSTANTSFTATIDDDSPTLTNVVGGGAVELDETGGFDTVTSTTSAIGFTANFGADGAKTGTNTEYSIERTTGGSATTLQTAVGNLAISLVQTAPNVIKGQYNDGTVKDAFIVTINANGTITVQQLVALEHTVDGFDAAAYNDVLTLDGLISARVKITDADGDTTSETTQIGDQITFRDDGLLAAPDTKSVAEGAVVNGNVLSDNADTFGTDGPDATIPAGGVVGVKAGSDTSAPVTTGTGSVIETPLGFLTLNANGTYSYDSKGNTVGTTAVTDTFVYTIRDADGDTSTTTLTITINPVTLAGADQTVIVNEAALDLVQDPADLAAGTVTGSQPTLGTETVTGTLTTTGATGAVTYTPQSVSDALGNFVLNADGTYKYTLKSAVDGPTLDNGTVTHPAVRTFTYTVTDASGNTDTGTITIDVIDDVPTARADTDSVREETALIANGNVLTAAAVATPDANTTDGVADTQGADGATVTGVAFGAVAGPVTGGVGTLIDTPLGSLTLLAGGGYTYTLDNTNPTVQALGAGEFATETFTYTITDGDGDTSTTTLVIRIDGTNDLPTIAPDSNAVSEEGLPGGIADTIGTTPTADTTNLKTATGTVNVADLDGDALTVTLGTPATALTSGGVTITWALTDGGKTLTGSAGATPVIVATITNGGVYNVELKAPIDHPDTVGTGPATFEDALSLVIPVSVNDGTTTITDPSGLTISIEDDSPSQIAPEAASLSNNATGIDTGYLSSNGLADNWGGDGPGTVRFAASLETTASGMTAAGQTIKYDVSADGLTLFAYTGASAATGVEVFTATLNPATNQYTIDMARSVDSITKVILNPTSAGFVGGNDPWAGFDRAGANDILLTPTGTGDQTLNTSSILLGVGGGNQVDGGEGVRIDFVTNLTGNPAGNGGYSVPANQDHGFTGHYTSNGSSVRLTQENGSNIIANFRAFDDYDADTVVGDGTPDPVTGITLTYLGVTYTAPITGEQIIVPTLTATNYTVNGRTFTVQLLANGSVNVSNIEGDNGSSGAGTEVAIFTADGYSSLVVSNATAGSSFKVSSFGLATPSTAPVLFSLPVEIVDRDGDVIGGTSIAVTLNPAPVVLDLNGDGAQFLSLAQGVSFDYGAGAIHTAWVDPADGLLAFDGNASGGIDDAGEIVFGGGGLTDLEALAAKYGDTLDVGDADYARFGVWQDADSDGASDAGEFHSLADLGISSIGLVSDGKAYAAAGGDVAVAGTATFTRADGSTGSVADASFAVDAKTAQRTAEIVSTAVLASAFGQATAAAAQPAEASEGHSRKHLAVETERMQIDSTADDDGRIAAHRSDVGGQKVQSSDDGDHASARIVGEASEARLVEFAASNDRGDAAPDYLGTHDAGPAHANGSAFAAMGSDGLMQALLSMGPQAATEAQAGKAVAAVEEALSDFAGEAMVDAIVGHFAGGANDAPAVAAANDGAMMLTQDLGGSAGLSHFAMMPDANDDASMLAASQA